MTFVSYAQNFEDVVLWRALCGIEQGFYMDAGAAWPDLHSVTKAFYMRGWRGVNIEPNPHLHAQLCESRPRDVNLQLALSRREGDVRLVVFTGTGLSTTVEQVAQQHIGENRPFSVVDVPAATLSSVWAEHVPEQQDVHFLKIDIEGCEAEIINGNDWSRFRPWVVLVEAMCPLSQTATHDAWEPALLEAGYLFAYADGLNRFYVESSHAELLDAFRFPPNVFDGFTLGTEVRALELLRQSEARVARSEAALQAAEAGLQGAGKRLLEAEQRVSRAKDGHRLEQERADQLEQQLLAVKASRSWRVTGPLRRVIAQAQKLRALLHRPQPDNDIPGSVVAASREEGDSSPRSDVDSPQAPAKTGRQIMLEKVVAGELESLKRSLW
jgi:FkbM family methyltransferase